MSSTQTITIGRQHFRVRPWQSDASIAQVSPAPGSATPSSAEIDECLRRVADLGYSSALTSAIDTTEAPVYRSLGFEERDRLRVLRHDLQAIPASVNSSRLVRDSLESDDGPGEVTLRRMRRGDRDRCLEIDSAAFEPFWRLDAAGLSDAETATPSQRSRVAVNKGGGRAGIAGYAVTGRGGHQGFIQRLATDPEMQRRGVATELVIDSLSWCRRRRCREVFVNTQVSNTAATRLYEKLGFVTTPNDLVVLFWSGG